MPGYSGRDGKIDLGFFSKQDNPTETLIHSLKDEQAKVGHLQGVKPDVPSTKEAVVKFDQLLTSVRSFISQKNEVVEEAADNNTYNSSLSK